MNKRVCSSFYLEILKFFNEEFFIGNFRAESPISEDAHPYSQFLNVFFSACILYDIMFAL